jgi:hypothetical protein
MSDRNVVLNAERVVFYSMTDESSFFEWLARMPFVLDVAGRGLVVEITVDPLMVNDDGLRELIALFQRYRVSMRQLRVFDCEEFSHWFRRRNTFWYKKVFC